MAEGIQVTKKPVNFTEEAKELFKALPEMVAYVDDAITMISTMMAIIDRRLGGLTKEEKWSSESETIEHIIKDIRNRLDTINQMINDLIRKGLLKEDLEPVLSIRAYISSAREEINSVAKTVLHGDIQDLLRAWASLDMAKTDLKWTRFKVLELCELYHNDPPEGDLLSLGKIVGIGVVALLLFGAVLKYLPDRW